MTRCCDQSVNRVLVVVICCLNGRPSAVVVESTSVVFANNPKLTRHDDAQICSTQSATDLVTFFLLGNDTVASDAGSNEKEDGTVRIAKELHDDGFAMAISM